MKIRSPQYSLLAAILFLGFFTYACYFLYNQIEQNLSVTKINEEKWRQEFARREEIQMLDRAVKNIQKESVEIDNHFVKSEDVVPFLNTIEALAPRVGTRAETASVDISSDKTSLLVRIEVEGSFSGIYKFIKLLENSPYQLEFTSVDLLDRGVVGSNKLPVWGADLSIRILSFIYN